MNGDGPNENPMDTHINAYTIEQWRKCIRAQKPDNTTGEDLFVLLCLDEIEKTRKERESLRARAEQAETDSKHLTARLVDLQRWSTIIAIALNEVYILAARAAAEPESTGKLVKIMTTIEAAQDKAKGAS